MELNDRFDARELAFVDLGILGQILQRPHLRQHIHDLFERAHLANLLELTRKSSSVNSSLRSLRSRSAAAFLINRLLDAFDERHEVAHAEKRGRRYARDKILLRASYFSPRPTNFNRCAGHFADAKAPRRRRVAIELRSESRRSGRGACETLRRSARHPDPIMESAIKRISLGCNSFFSVPSSFINSSSNAAGRPCPPGHVGWRKVSLP